MTTTAAPLFGGSSRGSANKNLVEFRAGKMQLKTNNMVHPDKRKGLVYIYQSDDSLMHFCWKDRTSGTVEDDLIIFPDDIEYKKVAECTTGRVFLLKFKSTNRKFFFWMQEPKTDKDEDYCSKVNEYLNHPPSVSSSGERDLHSLLNNMDQQQLMQLFGNTQQLSSLLGAGRGSGARERMRERLDRRTTSTTSSTSTTTTTTASVASSATTTTSTTTVASPTSTTPAAPIRLTDLQNILQGITVPNSPPAQKSAELSSAFNAETLQPILSNSDFLERLRPFLPDTEEESALPTADQLKDTVHSPQFQQAMSLFSVALSSGQLGPLMQQFNLGEDAVAAATKGDMEAFLKALQNKKSDEGKEDKDEEME